jgi:prephenate dehydrogenase
LRTALQDADLVVLATPLPAVCGLISDIAADALAGESTIMDLAGLKAPVARAAKAAGLDGRFVGAHPMAGSESSGFSAARPDLFDGALVWIVAEPEANARAARIEGLWRSLGTNPVRTSAAEHDRLMALVSHLPQLTANSLAAALAAAGVRRNELGPGGRDMTRLAASSPEMWAPLFESADPALVDALRRMAGSLQRMADELESEDVEAIVSLMEQTRTWRDE